ncbi:MAG: helix-turn-helix domain-containing protein [Faecalibacterium sp.]|jgi:transcriptional regulator with XRE-family HTH domain|uniref:helix-turn-helix domain-containing protein n=1 Tax=Oscillibacter sp. TaxID=1945593 RepID=UPI00289855FE|nr:helix-turn-helix transcriptional regulator [Oscillibacter sp.]MCI2047978.1 helix-turn-helix domain-containing protein [Faecalibacterium sp.]
MNDRHYKDYIQIGLNIMRYRKEQGLTQEQLADMTGYTRNHIQRVETANSKPSVGLILEVSKALRVPVEQLMKTKQ